MALIRPDFRNPRPRGGRRGVGSESQPAAPDRSGHNARAGWMDGP